MSNNGKRKLPEWLQRSVQKSKLGFNRVHEELKRLYDDSLKVVIEPDSKENLPTVCPKRNLVVNRLVRFMGSVKNSFKSRNRSRNDSSQCETTDSAATSSKPMGNIANTQRPKMNKPTERKMKGKMPHSEFLKSHVYTNDRVVHEQADGDNKTLSNESFELYTEIDEYLVDKDDSDDAESECQSLLDFGSPRSTSRQNVSDYDKHSFLCLDKHRYSPLTIDSLSQDTKDYMPMGKGGPQSTSRQMRLSRFKSTGDHRRCENVRLSTDSSHYAKISKSLPSQLSNCCENLNEANSTPRRSDIIASGRNNDPRTFSQNRHNKHDIDITSPKKTEQAGKRMEDISENHEADDSGPSRSFYDHTVEEVAECFRNCAFIRLAQVCLDEQLDGEYFRDITGDDLKQEPFNMNWFHIRKLFKVINGWKPKNSIRLDQ